MAIVSKWLCRQASPRASACAALSPNCCHTQCTSQFAVLWPPQVDTDLRILHMTERSAYRRHFTHDARIEGANDP